MNNINTPAKKKSAVKVHICSSRLDMLNKMAKENSTIIDWGQVHLVGYFYLTISDYGNQTEVSPNEEGLQPFKHTLKRKK